MAGDGVADDGAAGIARFVGGTSGRRQGFDGRGVSGRRRRRGDPLNTP
jgi:hypothetical protein